MLLVSNIPEKIMSLSLSAQNVVKRYGGVVALSDGNLDVHSGEVVALVGANGSGKPNASMTEKTNRNRLAYAGILNNRNLLLGTGRNSFPAALESNLSSHKKR